MSAAADDLPVGFRPGDRHGWLDRFCASLDDIIVGEAAGTFELDPQLSGPNLTLVRLPSFGWYTPSRAAVGRKGASRGGGSLLLPARIVYEHGPLLALGPKPAGTHRFTAKAPGLAASGQVGDDRAVTVCSSKPAAFDVPAPRVVAVGTRRVIARSLRQLSADAKAAKFELLVAQEPYVRRAVLVAHSSVRYELASFSGVHRPLVDTTDEAAIVDGLLFGDAAGSPGAVGRIIDRCCQPHTFDRVDPVRYVSVALRRDAMSALRRYIGDPSVGPKVRQVAAAVFGEVPAHPDADALALLIARYTAAYPGDSLGASRALAALHMVRHGGAHLSLR